MAGIITRGSFPKLLWPGLNAIWGMAYKEHAKGQEWRQIFEVLSSAKAYEEDVGMTGMGLAPLKPEGEALSYDTMKQNFVSRYTNLSYAIGFVITREEIADNQYQQFGRDRAINLAFSMHQTVETLGANVINRAQNGSYLGGDGVTLASALHPIEGGTFANQLAVAADLSESSLEQACIDISKFVDNRNNKISVMPAKLIIPPELMYEADRILKSPYRPDSANNDINALYQMGKFPGGAIVNHYLSDENAWSIITNCPNGLRAFERQAPKFEDDNDFDTKNAKFSGFMRYAFGWTDPRGFFFSPGA